MSTFCLQVKLDRSRRRSLSFTRGLKGFPNQRFFAISNEKIFSQELKQIATPLQCQKILVINIMLQVRGEKFIQSPGPSEWCGASVWARSNPQTSPHSVSLKQAPSVVWSCSACSRTVLHGPEASTLCSTAPEQQSSHHMLCSPQLEEWHTATLLWLYCTWPPLCHSAMRAGVGTTCTAWSYPAHSTILPASQLREDRQHQGPDDRARRSDVACRPCLSHPCFKSNYILVTHL